MDRPEVKTVLKLAVKLFKPFKLAASVASPEYAGCFLFLVPQSNCQQILRERISRILYKRVVVGLNRIVEIWPEYVELPPDEIEATAHDELHFAIEEAKVGQIVDDFIYRQTVAAEDPLEMVQVAVSSYRAHVRGLRHEHVLGKTVVKHLVDRRRLHELAQPPPDRDLLHAHDGS